MPTVLITGTSSGIGKATVERFAAAGWQVVATMRQPADAADFDWPDDVLVERLDLNDANSILLAKTAAEARFGLVDVVVNNAGYGLTGAIETCSEAQVRAFFETNLFGTLRVIRTFLPQMRERDAGMLINVSSIGGRMTFPFYGYYNAGKHALESLSEAIWLELHDTGVRVKLIEPGFTQTDFATGGLQQGEHEIPFYAERIERLTQRLQQGQSGSPPTAIAEAIFRAANDPSSRLRYSAGKYAWLLLTLRRWLPDRVFMNLIRRAVAP